MPMRRRSRAGSELAAKDESRSFLPQHERDQSGEGMTGWKGLWRSQQWVIVSFAVAFGLFMLYVLAVCGFYFSPAVFEDVLIIYASHLYHMRSLLPSKAELPPGRLICMF